MMRKQPWELFPPAAAVPNNKYITISAQELQYWKGQAQDLARLLTDLVDAVISGDSTAKATALCPPVVAAVGAWNCECGATLNDMRDTLCESCEERLEELADADMLRRLRYGL